MKAFILERYGKKRPLQLANVPVPEIHDDEVLVQVHAAGVNLLDSKIRDGDFKAFLRYRMPLVLGHDVAGEVVKVGAGVRQFRCGDPVYAVRMICASARSPSSSRSGNRRWPPSPRA